MHFHKYPHPSNFEFPGKIAANHNFKTRRGTYRLTVRAAADDVYHLQITGKGWENNESQAGLRLLKASKKFAGKQTELHFSPRGDLRLKGKDGRLLLSSLPKRLSGDGTAQTRYVFDDGHSFAYQKEGKRSEVEITAQRTGTALAITVNTVSNGYGKGEFTFTTEKIIRTVTLNGVRVRRVSTQGIAFGARKLTTWSL